VPAGRPYIPEEGPLLTQDQIDQYHELGYVIPDYQLPMDVVEEMRKELELLIEANPDKTADAMFVPHAPQGNHQGLKSPRADKWLEFACNNDIIDMVGQLIGQNIALWGSTVFGKPAGTGKATPWHQDGQYWPIKPLASCTAWIAIDDVGVENGCMRVIPGSHKSKDVYSHHTNKADDLTLNQELDEDQFNEADALDMILKPGQMSFHDIYMVHGSRHNTSTKRRAGYVLRFMPTTSHFDREFGLELERNGNAVNFSNRPLFLVSGVDQSGLNDFEIGHL